jgi:hypothetical protein
MFPAFRAPLVALLLAAPAVAQIDTTRSRPFWQPYDGPRRLEVSVSAGYAFSTDWSDRVTLDVFDTRGGAYRQILLRDVAVAPGAGGEVAVTYWKGRYGFRVHAGYSQSCLTTASRCGARPAARDAALSVAEVPMDIWRYGVMGVVGLRNYAGSRFFRPYLLVGAGGVAYDSDEDVLPLFPGTFQRLTPPGDALPGTVYITDGTSAFLIATDELGLENAFSLTLGVGTDFRIPAGPGGLSLRVELVDQITNSPFSVRVARLDNSGRFGFGRGIDETTFHAGAIHNLRLTAGVALEFGLRGPREEHDPWTRLREWPADTLDAATEATWPRSRRGRTGG